MWRASWLRPTVVLAFAACVLTSCAASPRHDASGGGSTTGVSAYPDGLSVSAVVSGRFVHTVDLDGGDFEVQPPGDTRAHVKPSTAQTMFDAADSTTGDYPFAILGLGVVTISSSVSSTSDTLPAPGAASSTSSSSTPSSGTASSSPTSSSTTSPKSTASTTTPSPTTSASVSDTATTAPANVTTTAPAAPSARVPAYDGRLAWVGLAWGPACASSDDHSKDTRLVAVVFDAQSGRDVVSYTSGASVCGAGSEPPRVSVPDELVSVPWQPVGPFSTAVVAALPACATYYGWTELSGQDTGALEVVARRPYEPDCTPATARTQTVDDVVPLGGAQSQVPHAALGPVDALHDLPSN